MKVLFIALIFAWSTMLQATPTAEGLFRNVSNKEPTGNLILVTAMVEPMQLPLKENSLIVPPIATNVSSEEVVTQPVYYKWLLSLEREKIIDMIQVTYDKSQMKEKDIISTRYLPDIAKVISGDNSLERSIFYGLMSVLVLNESKIMGNVISKYAQGFVPNKELMLREKVGLYHRYKDYLEQRQENETLVSPLEPEDEERSQQVKEILKSPMYRDAGNVKLVRTDSELAWKVDLKNLVALFSNETHRLKRLDYQSPLGDLRVITDEYVLFDGGHELPKTIIIKDMAQKTWKVRFTGLSHLNTRSTPFTKRAQDYAKAAKDARSNAKADTVKQARLSPPFIF